MQTVVVEDNVEITTTYTLGFCRTHDRHSGFSFPCDENGIVDESTLNPLALENYRKCVTGEHDVVRKGVEKSVNRIRLCSCGSGKYPERADDARGIFIANVCDDCRKERLKGYRLEVLEDPNYECDEPIEPDEDY